MLGFCSRGRSKFEFVGDLAREPNVPRPADFPDAGGSAVGRVLRADSDDNVREELLPLDLSQLPLGATIGWLGRSRSRTRSIRLRRQQLHGRSVGWRTANNTSAKTFRSQLRALRMPTARVLISASGAEDIARMLNSRTTSTEQRVVVLG